MRRQVKVTKKEFQELRSEYKKLEKDGEYEKSWEKEDWNPKDDRIESDKTLQDKKWVRWSWG